MTLITEEQRKSVGKYKCPLCQSHMEIEDHWVQDFPLELLFLDLECSNEECSVFKVRVSVSIEIKKESDILDRPDKRWK